jgi:hypothetical protein
MRINFIQVGVRKRRFKHFCLGQKHSEIIKNAKCFTGTNCIFQQEIQTQLKEISVDKED